MMTANKYIFIIVFLFSVLFVKAQFVYNNGAIFHINTIIVHINGDLENDNSGNILNDGDFYITSDITNNALIGGNGTYNISGDWINNNNFNPGLSSVFLEGADQFITGTVSTTFNNLNLVGTGVKTLQINTSLDGILALNDRELATNDYTISVLTTNINAITRTTGFVSSLNNGSLLRATANNSVYEFPVGSSIGTLRYRPVEIIPASANANIFTVQMVNNDATTDGYDRTYTDTAICATNPYFYHRINRATGSDAADISIYYDELVDSLWDGMAQWDTVPSTLWENMGLANVISATPLSSVTVQNWNDFSTDPYILTLEMPSVDLGPDTFVCNSSYITIDAGAGFDTYVWSDGTTVTQTIDIYMEDTYYVTVTIQGCTAIDSIKVIERPTPVANAGENMTICAGEPITLTGSGGTSYEWSTTETTQSIVVSPSVTTIYWVTVTENYCWDDDSVIVTTIPLPNAYAGADQTVCIGDTISLMATGGSGYEWSTGSFNQIIDVNPTVTTTYYVTVTDNGCNAVDTVVVNIIPYVIADAGVDQSVCEGDTLILTATGGVNYLWSTNETTSSITVNPFGTTTYYVTVSAGTCGDTDSVTVNVYPVPSADAGLDQSICDGQSTTLTASGGDTYVWSTSQNGATISVSPSVTTTYYVTVTSNGCSDVASVAVTIIAAPAAYAGLDQTICEGDTVTLTATGGTTYLWSNSAVGATTDVSPNTTTIYYVTVSDTNGCTAEDDVIINVLSIPNAFAGQDVNICLGDTVQLNASGGTSYQWDPVSGLSNPNISNPYANPITTTDYLIVVSNGTCADSDTVTVNVLPLPGIFAGNDTSIYLGDEFQLNATNLSTYFYLWTPTDYLSNPLIYNPVSTPDIDITYTIEVTDENGCKSSDNITIYIIEKPGGDLVIYNTFTPNGDNVNDFWEIDNIEQYPDNIIKVYNRNGHIVFETTNYQNNWDGKYFGNNLPAATYYYIIDMGDGTEVYKGNVTIIR